VRGIELGRARIDIRIARRGEGSVVESFESSGDLELVVGEPAAPLWGSAISK
jgi:hypothetical protein